VSGVICAICGKILIQQELEERRCSYCKGRIGVFRGPLRLSLSILRELQEILERKHAGIYVRLLSERDGDKVVGPFPSKEAIMDWYLQKDDWDGIDRIELG